MRKLVFIVLGVTVFSMPVVAAPAGAAYPPPTGHITCVIAGEIDLSSPLSFTPSPGAIKAKGRATSSSCNNAAVTGGKAPITAATVKLSGSILAGATSANLVDPNAYGKTKIQIKWRGLNPRGRLSTVATTNAVLIGVGFISTNPLVYTITGGAPAKGAFAQHPIVFTLGLDYTYDEIIAACQGPGVPDIDFGEINVATVEAG